LKHVNVTAPPAILFFDTHSTEMRGYRLVGSMDADEFLAHVNQVIQP
jgi:thiol:disulfide interchange protein